jgi:hypothetical protein
VERLWQREQEGKMGEKSSSQDRGELEFVTRDIINTPQHSNYFNFVTISLYFIFIIIQRGRVIESSLFTVH